MTPRPALAACATTLLLLAGCSTADDEPRDPDSSDPTSAAPDVDYPDDGLDLVDSPQLKGVYQDAIQTYIDFERGRRLTAREGRVTRLLAFSALADVVAPYRAALKAYGDRGTYSGDVTVEFISAQPHGDRLLLDVCVDARMLVVPDGAPTQLGEGTRAPQHIEVSNIVGPWRVTKAVPIDGSC
ncbi:hypothetical protein F0U44_13585 [Nocardioides humilatus]|uniref:Lipoprotein n=1 Tax=Nocardioides humilatus TaxID=2607660 RepID=A0A5B1LGW0_9ACTN|nr:hypothetical protein [Nocardioides humilatus]KAA1419458.1 hypothetical protein F0U44_13585 [Nocardioides humilatus]